MPWTAQQFKEKHNKKLSLPAARRAAAQAEGMMKAGVGEGEAIATANKNAGKSIADHLYGKGEKK